MNSFRSSLWLLAAALTTAWPALAAVPPAEKLLPADTLAVFTVPDADKASAASKEFSLGQLWNDPAMRPFTYKFETKLRELIGQEDKNFSRDWQEFRPLLGGQITFAVIRNDWAGELNTAPDFALLLDVKDKAKQLAAFLERCEKRDADAGKTIRHETLRGVKFARTTSAKGDAAVGAQKKPQPYVGQAGSLLLLSESPKALEKILARLDGAGTGLDGSANFMNACSTVGRDVHAFGWVDMKAFLDVVAKVPAGQPDANPFGIAPGRILDAIGLSGMNGLAMAARQGADGTHIELAVQAPQARRKGLLSLLAIEAAEAGPLPNVGGDTAKFTRIRMDGQKAFATIERILTDLNPQMAGVVTLVVENIGKDKDPNFDLRKQIIGNLGADFVTVQQTPRGKTAEDLKSPPTLYLLGSPKPDALLQALRTASPLPPQEREFLGKKIYSLALLPGMGVPAGGKGQILFAAAGGYLAVSTDAAMLEGLLRGAEGQGKPLAQLPGLADAAQKVGGFNTGWFQYENQNETLRLMLETLKKDPAAIEQLFAPPVPTPGANFAPLRALQGIMDFSLLPPFEAISKYFGFNLTAASSTPEGIHFKSFLPVPAGLKK